MFAKLNKNSYLGPILRPYVWRIWLLSGLSVLLSVLQVGMALIFRSVIDAVLAHRADAQLWSVLLVADLVLQVGVYALYKGYAASITDKLTAVLRLRLLDSAVNCEDSRLEGFHSGQLLYPLRQRGQCYPGPDRTGDPADRCLRSGTADLPRSGSYPSAAGHSNVCRDRRAAAGAEKTAALCP